MSGDYDWISGRYSITSHHTHPTAKGKICCYQTTGGGTSQTLPPILCTPFGWIHLDVQGGTLGGWYRRLHGEKWDLDIRVRLLFKFKEIPKNRPKPRILHIFVKKLPK